MAGLSSLTSRDAVLNVIADFDRVGYEAFLEHHHFGPVKWWSVVQDGEQYNSKAIVGVAIDIQTGQHLTSNDFKSGESNAVKKLQALDFIVVRLRIGESSSPIPEEVSEAFPEGMRLQVVVNRAERNSVL